jgi:hypothetical protein
MHLSINILNPKLSIFFLAFLPQFVSTNDPHTLSHMLGLSAVFMLLTFIVFVGYGLGAAAGADVDAPCLRRRLLRPRGQTGPRGSVKRRLTDLAVWETAAVPCSTPGHAARSDDHHPVERRSPQFPTHHAVA